MIKKIKQSLPLQIIIAVIAGVALGALFPDGQLKPFSEVGKAIIHWVKIIAGPFLFCTIVASVVEVQLRLKDGFKLIAVAVFNTVIAIVIGMSLAKAFLGDVQIAALAGKVDATKAPEMTLGFSAWIKNMMPTSLFQPFAQNDILLLALLALMIGIAIRKIYRDQGDTKLRSIAQNFETVRAVPGLILTWLIHIIPLAVLTVVAGSVSEYGFEIFSALIKYVGVVLLGFVLHAVVVYGTWIFAVRRVNIKNFFREARAPLAYAFGVNSSLATLPLTLKSLKNLGVSDRAASLGAGVATNLNNDGIVLYEALAVFFIAQLNHIQLTDMQMIAASLACLVAAMGITGIPEAGFISLSIVVSSLNLPAEALPLLLAVDWMLARGRSVVNVLSDMTLSIVVDERRKT